MEKNTVTKIFSDMANLLLFQPPKELDPFVLDETEYDTEEKDNFSTTALQERSREMEFLLDYARGLQQFLNKAIKTLQNNPEFGVIETVKKDFEKIETQWTEIKEILLKNRSTDGMYNNSVVSTSLDGNEKILEAIYNLPINKDIVIRKISIGTQPRIQVMMVFMDGLIDKKVVNLSILEPLLFMQERKEKLEGEDLIGSIMEKCLPSGQATRISSFVEVQQGINTGDAILFFEGSDEAVAVEAKGYEHRSIGKPETEQSVRGSQNAFTEVLRVNTALIRTMLHASDLVTEMIPVGARGHSNCAVMYIKSIANKELVSEVKRRIKGIRVDFIADSGILEHFIVDDPRNPFPQTLSTERPDRMAVHLTEGRVGILVDGSPFGHIVPVSIFTLMHASDDFSLSLYYTNMLRIIRWFSAMLSLLLPALYLAISTFHQEAIPTDLLLSITAARAQVPFPTIIEILLMEISFELIREGGLRIPGILGSTIGIVGALILGQTAVTAKIVSPMMVIVIAVTGLASYSIPDYRLASAFRLFRFLFILLAMGMGLIGIACGLLALVAMISSMKSFGMPYLTPVAPKTVYGGDVVLRSPVYQQERRPDELNTKDSLRQETISRVWTRKNRRGREKDE
ncbi:spore germination protein [Pelosinus sp. UFO1]|uniref:spore germination protein n=1 Tax=Pelosinus sp. UFO1 TaxID=484770 RepID=UPI0004D196F1|nr:spore germination protein [Pelosinus sp. UFO1]AIF50040.1 GerA spore germination protein [Pelosinus sp. UFO1]